jgi:UDPglucose 6-dehydrogenase
MEETQRIYGERTDLALCSNKYSALEGADALAICTEWQQFRAPDFEEMQALLRAKLIIDGRNLYNPDRLTDDGWHYYSIGRSQPHTSSPKEPNESMPKPEALGC